LVETRLRAARAYIIPGYPLCRFLCFVTKSEQDIGQGLTPLFLSLTTNESVPGRGPLKAYLLG